MKKLLFIIGLLLTTQIYCQTDTLTPNSKIKDVTVFFSGAQVGREARVNLSSGKHLLFFDRLPEEINPQSLQVKGSKGVQILSVKHQLNYLDKSKKSKQEQAIRDQIEQQKIDMKSVGDEISVLDVEENLLLKNSTIKHGENGTTVQQLSDIANFYRKRLGEIKKKKLAFRVQLKNQQKELESLYQDLNQLIVFNRQTYSQVMVTVKSSGNLTGKLSLSYFIPSAGWEPMYDFRVKDIASPLSIVYNANVYQSSGENWENVDIVLSSGDPTQSGLKPTLSRFYLGRPQTQHRRRSIQGTSAVSGRIFDVSSRNALPFCNITIYRGSQQVAATTTDFDGMYTLKPIPAGNYTMKVSYVGFQTVEKNNLRLVASQTAIVDVAMQKGVELNNVAITEYAKPIFEKDQSVVGNTTTRYEIERMAVRSVADIARTTGNGVFSRDDGAGLYNVRGARSGESVTFIDGVKVIGTSTGIQKSEINLISNSIKQGATDFEYRIKIPYTIPSDGEDYQLKIKETQLAVDYLYYTVPKIEPVAFLTAQIPEWNELNLLSGKTSIYYEGVFKSQAYLNVEKADDTLSISLGRDKGIVVSRKLDKNTTEKKNFNRNIKETVGLKIDIRNNKRSPIKIVVEDQYPISERDAVEVELLESSEAEIDKKEAKLTWELELKPQEEKEIKIGYSVKYPRYAGIESDF